MFEDSPLLLQVLRYLGPLFDLFVGLIILGKGGLFNKRLFASGFFLYAFGGGMWTYAVNWHWIEAETWASFSPWIYYLGVAFVLIGAIQLQSGGSLLTGGSAMLMTVINRFLSTDELISRVAELSTVNDDLEELKGQWYKALEALVLHDPDHTALIDSGKYGRTLLLEKYSPMGSFDSFSCGQLRTVELSIAGPGDPQAWMTVTVKYSVDHTPVGTFTIENDVVMRSRDDVSELRELKRISGFLDTGRARRAFLEGFEKGMRNLLSFLLIPVHLIILGAGLLMSFFRAMLNRKKVTTRFMATQRPSILPLERAGAPVGYWYVLLENQADKHGELAGAMRAALGERSEFGATTYEKEVVQWGGYSLKEVRQQTVVELRRCKVYIGIYRYGQDLYVRWDSHVNRSTWNLQKFSYSTCAGYRFSKDLFSWARPLFEEVPSIYEFAPSISATTDYDWADLDALEGLVHEIMTQEVKKLKERYDIEKEIDFEIKKGQAGLAEPATSDEAKSSRSERRGPIAWAAGFARRQ